MTTLDEVGSYVGTNVGSLTLGTNLFIGMMPDTPTICAAIFETASMAPDFTMNGSDAEPVLENPRIMLYVRHSSYSTGRSLIDTIWKQMQNVSNESLSSVTYLRIQGLGSPEFLERDKNFNVMFRANFQVMKELS
jgi:hypothetical protein